MKNEKKKANDEVKAVKEKKEVKKAKKEVKKVEKEVEKEVKESETLETVSNIIPVSEYKKQKRSKAKKIIIIISIVIVLGVAAFFALKLFILPSVNYNKANSKMEEHDYKSAVSIYESLGEFKDSKTKLDSAYFEYGKDLIKKEEYEEAINSFKKTTNKEKDKFIIYATALNNIKKGEYETGIKSLKEMEDFEDAKESVKKGYYLQGENYLKDKKYDSAVKSFTEADDYKDAKDKINNALFLNAEEAYKDGNLAVAKANFQKVDKDYEYNNVKVSDRLDTLNKYSSYVSLAGDYSGSGKMEVREIWKYDGSWESWYSSYSDSAKIRCVINDDGSVKITGNVDFYSYTNWSTISSYVNSKEISVPIAIDVKKGNKMPTTLASGWPALTANSGTVGKAKVTFESGKLKLSFDLNDKNYSQSFTHRYMSNATYSKKK